MSAITTHVLDISAGKPAAGVTVTLDVHSAEGWKTLAGGTTNADGRLRDLLPEDAPVAPGTYRLRFETAVYFRTRGMESFYPHVEITFQVKDGTQHYHVPLLIAPHGYTTYRGS